VILGQDYPTASLKKLGRKMYVQCAKSLSALGSGKQDGRKRLSINRHSSLCTGNLPHIDKLQSMLLVHWPAYCREEDLSFCSITLLYVPFLDTGQRTVVFTIPNFLVHISRLTLLLPAVTSLKATRVFISLQERVHRTDQPGGYSINQRCTLLDTNRMIFIPL